MKKLKVGDKIKILSLEKLIKKCLKEDIGFNVDDDCLEIYGDEEIYIDRKHLDKEHEITSINTSEDNISIDTKAYHFCLYDDTEMNDLEFLTGKKYGIKAPNLKRIIQRGEILPNYEIKMYTDKVSVGCQDITKDNCQKLFEVLGDYLGYEVG